MSYFYIPKNYTNLSPSFVCVDVRNYREILLVFLG